MSSLQNALCRKIENPFSHKIKQPQKGCKKSWKKHGKFILIEQLNNINNTSIEVLKQRLKDRENYWIKRLKTLTPFVD